MADEAEYGWLVMVMVDGSGIERGWKNVGKKNGMLNRKRAEWAAEIRSARENHLTR